MLFYMQIQKLLRVLFFVIGATVVMLTTKARAEPPHLADYWEPTHLNIRACVQRGIMVLREIGFQDAHPGRSGKVAFGNRDDNHMEVICSIPNWVVFVGASSSLDQIVNYRNELAKRF